MRGLASTNSLDDQKQAAVTDSPLMMAIGGEGGRSMMLLSSSTKKHNKSLESAGGLVLQGDEGNYSAGSNTQRLNRQFAFEQNQ